MYGSDAMNSTEPEEFAQLVHEIRQLELAITTQVDKDEKASLLGGMKMIFQKSIVSSRNIKKGTILQFDDLAFKKPGDGIPASRYNELIGKVLSIDVMQNHKFELNDFN